MPRRKHGTRDETMSPSDVLFLRDCLPESDTRALTKSVERIAELELEVARAKLAEAEIVGAESRHPPPPDPPRDRLVKRAADRRDLRRPCRAGLH